MAKYQITHSCGHTEERQLLGPEATRQSYIVWAGQHGTCSECRKADAEATIVAVEAENDLQPLQGSEKQVAWARKIRAKLVAEALATIDGMRAVAIQQDKLDEFEINVSPIQQMVLGETAARYWIDNKDKSGKELCQAAYKATRR